MCIISVQFVAICFDFLAIANYDLLVDWQSKVEGLLSDYGQFLYVQDVKKIWGTQ